MIGLRANPSDHSTDNGLLFSSTYLMLLSDMAQVDDALWFTELVDECSILPGCLARYPGESDPSSWDDHVGVAVAAHHFDHSSAVNLWNFGRSHGFVYGSNFLARITGFIPVLKCAAGEPLTFIDQLLASIGFIANIFEKREETSGKCILYLEQKLFRGKYPLVDFAISLWKKRMTELYPAGMRQVYTIYFGGEHPFAQYGPVDFE